MLRKRVIPCLLLQNQSLVKTTSFKNPNYIGDAINTVRIFNELEVDEMIVLDIGLNKFKYKIQYDLLRKISSECFIPLAYGGGIKNLDEAKKIIDIGFEKIIINSSFHQKIDLINEISNELGSQSIIGSVDVKKNILGNYKIFTNGGKKKEKVSLLNWIKKLEEKGVGEIMITSIDKEGSWQGFDYDLINIIAKNVNVPIIAHGGAGSINDIIRALEYEISAVAIGNLFVYQKKGMGVLINTNEIKKLKIDEIKI